MAPSGQGKKGLEDLVQGAVLQVIEAATLGLPCEVWKTRMCSDMNAKTWQSLIDLKRERGLAGFWRGFNPKMVECVFKGAVLYWAKEGTMDIMQPYVTLNGWYTPTANGAVGGLVGGVAQSFVMAPSTMLVTNAVVNTNGLTSTQLIQKKFAGGFVNGVRSMYTGLGAIAGRQASNWVIRQAAFEWSRQRIMDVRYKHWTNEERKKKTMAGLDEILAGTMGGIIGAINHPFEIIRVQQQRAVSKGEPRPGAMACLRHAWNARTPSGRQRFIFGWYQGLIPRVTLSIWQTVFMCSFGKVIQSYWKAAFHNK